MSSTYPTRPTDAPPPPAVHLGNAAGLPIAASKAATPPIVSEEEIALAKVLAEEMFGATAEIEECSQPGDPSDRWIDVRVDTPLRSKELLSKQLEWYGRLQRLIGDRSFCFALLATPTE